jgi:tripartite-type tricarboxylate transporter receptor subunit TctC
MVKLRRNSAWLSAFAIMLCATSLEHVAVAQPYPSKPVRLIVSSAAGGGDDFFGRAVAQELTKILGQQFIVDNRPGAGGALGQDFVAKSPPDGYTLLLGGGSMTGAQFVKANLPFNVLRDFAPVSLVANLQSCLLVHPAVPARNTKEFIALAKSRPGKLNFGSGGVGQTAYFAAVYLNSMAKIDTVHVPFKSFSEVVVDVMSGQIEYFFGPTPVAVTQTNAGKLRALGVTGAKRSPVLPDIPTIAEAAIPGYELYTWLSILAPAKTPRPLIDKLNSAVSQSMALPEMRERITKAGAEPLSSTPEELAKRMADGVEKYGHIAKLAGLKPE